MNELSLKLRRAYTQFLPKNLRRQLELAIRGPYPSVFDKHKFIFIHIPKTAGKSLTKVLGSGGACHLSWRHYYTLLEEDINNYYVFTVIREPLDRLISSYTYMRNGGNQSAEDLRIKEIWIDPYSHFDDFVKNALTDPSIFNTRKFRPQTTFLENKRGSIEERINIFKFEDLEAAYHEIANNLDIKEPLPHTNSSNRASSITISDEAINIINNLYAKDFKNFGYTPIK